jgi:4-amino-4-deoxy-L-arabinose transferase-like glycosyltransferase
MFSIPFQHGPDEGAHYQVVRFIRDSARLPRFAPDELWLIRTPSGAIETYATYPPLAYLVAALPAAIFRESSLWATRLVSVFSFVGTVGLTYLLARLIVPAHRPVAVLAALTLTFFPQLVFTAAYVNNDGLAVLLATALAVVLATLVLHGMRWWLLLLIGLLCGGLLITKYPFYAGAAVAGGVAFLAALRARAWAGIAAAAIGVMLSAGWWFVRNLELYGEPIPSKVIAAAKASAGGNTLFVPINHGVDLLGISTQTDFWYTTLRSFVASFGFLSIYLEPRLYLIYIVLAVLGGVGLAGWVWHERPDARGWLLGVTGLVIAIVTLLSAMAISVYGEYSPQGRYLFPMLPALAVALGAGWYQLGRSHWLLAWVPGAIVFGLAALCGLCLFGYILARDFGSPMERLVIEVDRPSTPQPSDSQIVLLGWAIAQGSDRWRPFDPSAVDAYRRPVEGAMVFMDGPPGEGTFVGPAQYGFRRTDVAEFYGSNRALERIGLRYVFPPGYFSPGEHPVYACAMAATSLVPTCVRHVITVS